MNDVLLLAPPYKGMIREPIGLYYIASILKRNNISVKILDLNVERINALEFNEFIKAINPKIVGVTSYTFNFYNTLEILRYIKKNFPRITTVLGGVHASALPKETLEPSINYIIIGEGEIAFLELCQHLLNKQSPAQIPGLAFTGGEEHIHINSPRNPIANLDLLKIPERDAENYSKYPIGLVQTSRGCPYNCIFCNICSSYATKIRFRSPQLVVDECEYLVKTFKYKQLFFFGDSFTYDHDWVEQFCNDLIKRDLEFEWACETRVDNVDLTLMKRMKKAGCRNIQFGIDYGDNSVLKKLGKNITIDQSINAVEWAKASDLLVESFFIFNCPGENQDTMNNTFNLIQKIPVDAIELNLLTPYPGTKLWSNPERFGMRIIEKDFSQYTTKKYLLENIDFPRKKFVSAFKDLLKRLNLQTIDGIQPEIFRFLEAEKKIKTWI